MGNGAGKSNAGMPLSPRAEFADRCAAKTDAAIVIDAPALIDLGHGTVRYRREDLGGLGDDDDVSKPAAAAAVDAASSSTASNRKRQLGNKKGYFYHAKLSDYSEGAKIDPSESFKYKYVSRGMPKARGKRLFYVYGIGVNSVDAATNAKKAERPQGKGYDWPSTYRQRDHLYYQLAFVEGGAAEEAADEDDEDDISEDVDDQQPGTSMRFGMRDLDTVGKLKKRVAIRLLVPASHIHVMHQGGSDLSNEDIVGHLRSNEEGEFKRFTIELTPC